MKTTKQNFEYFKGRCLEWQQRLGLLGWEVIIVHKPLKDAYAQTDWRLRGAIATITLCTEWDAHCPLDMQQLDRVAFHETLHLLMAQLVAEAQDRWSNQDAVDIAEHNIIRTLENVFLDG